MSSVNSNPKVQPPPPPPPPPAPAPPVENKNAEVYGPPVPKAAEAQAATDAKGVNNGAPENKSPAQMSAENHSVNDLAKLKGAPAEVPATRPSDTVKTDAGELTRDEYNKRYKPESDGSISNAVPLKTELNAAKPDNLWDSATRAVGDFTSGVMNGRPGANGSGEVDLKTATDQEILSAQNMNAAQRAGANIHETYDRTASALDKGLTEAQTAGNNLANRDLFEGVDKNKMATPNGLVDAGSSAEVMKVGANYAAKVAGEGIDLVAGLGKTVGGVINGAPQWASNAGDLVSGKEKFNGADAAAAAFSGVSKVGYGLVTGVAVDLPARILAPGAGHDAVAKGIGDTQKQLDDSYRSDLKSVGVNPDSKTYKTVNEATEVVGNVAAIFAGGKGKGAATAEAGGAIVKAEAPGALVKTDPGVGTLVKAEPPGALVKTEKIGGDVGGNGSTPQKLLTGTPDRPLLKGSDLEPLPDLGTLKREPAAVDKAPTRSESAAKAVDVEVMPPEPTAAPNKTLNPVEPPTIDVTPSASRRAYTEITPEQLSFPTRQARDGTTIVSESYKGPTAKLQREAFQSQFEMRNAEPPGMKPYIEIINKADGKVVGEVANARVETALDFGINVADRLTKPAAGTGKLADTPLGDVLGRAEKAKGVFDKAVKLWDSLTNPKPPTSGAPSNIADQVARHKEMMSEIESQRAMSDPAKERTVPNSALPENRVLDVPGPQPRTPLNLPERLGEPLPDLGSLPRNESRPIIAEPEPIELPDNSTTPPEQLRMPPPGFDPNNLSPQQRAEYNADPQAYIKKHFGN